MSKVYILNQKGTNKYKIGVSNDVAERISQLQCGNPNKISKIIYRTVPDAYGIERYLHEQFQSCQCQGGGSEWFELTDFQVQQACAFIKNATGK